MIRGGTIGVGGCGPSNQSKKPFPGTAFCLADPLRSDSLQFRQIVSALSGADPERREEYRYCAADGQPMRTTRSRPRVPYLWRWHRFAIPRRAALGTSHCRGAIRSSSPVPGRRPLRGATPLPWRCPARRRHGRFCPPCRETNSAVYAVPLSNKGQYRPR